jgi:hypothetical protein
MNLSSDTPVELCALTDSLTSSIRWRMRDYEAILRAELEILAEPYAVMGPLPLHFGGPKPIRHGREN